MAYLTGTATDYKDALAQFVAFATNDDNKWVALRNIVDADGEMEIILRAPGINNLADEHVFTGIKTETNTVSNKYNWKLQGYTGFSSGTFDGQPGAMNNGGVANPNAVRLLLLNTGMTFWFFINSRRAIIVLKAGISYEIAYLGLILPYGPSENLPYPLVVAGSSNFSLSSINQSAQHNSWIAGQTYNSSAYEPKFGQFMFLFGQWIPQSYHHSSQLSTSGGTIYNCLALLPVFIGSSMPSGAIYQADFVPMFPIQLGQYGVSKNLFGELDGIVKISGRGLQSEDTITADDGKQLLVFQGCWRTDFYCYCAVEVA